MNSSSSSSSQSRIRIINQWMIVWIYYVIEYWMCLNRLWSINGIIVVEVDMVIRSELI